MDHGHSPETFFEIPRLWQLFIAKSKEFSTENISKDPPKLAMEFTKSVYGFPEMDLGLLLINSPFTWTSQVLPVPVGTYVRFQAPQKFVSNFTQGAQHLSTRDQHNIREALTPNVMEVVLADKSLPFSHWSMTTGSGAIRMKEHRVFPFGNENKQLRVGKNVKSSDPRRDRGAWEAV
ncbi:unnamed protein product [Nesidiocoris tenuis]|uniref:Uncharacterized protein n=1 Tax=Nesidiocoris tenuis TaxID=355587 RepID=A0A6H5G9N6_9HEMI|nr:unnamed protein product [Nesidiocoris tenuis]